jgi:hypothetical protein
LIIQKKENELDPDTQLEKRSFAAIDSNVGGADKAVIRFWRFADAASLSLLSGEGH